MRPVLNSAASPIKLPPEPLPSAPRVVHQSVLLSAAEKQTQHQAKQAQAANKRAAAKEQQRQSRIMALSVTANTQQSMAQQAVQIAEPGGTSINQAHTSAATQALSVLQTAYQSLPQAGVSTSQMAAGPACPPLPNAQVPLALQVEAAEAPVNKRHRSGPARTTKRSHEKVVGLARQSCHNRRQRRAPAHLQEYHFE